MKTKIVILICCFSLLATSAYAVAIIPDTTIFFGYDSEGKFVEIPARCGGIIGLSVGLIVSVPILLVGAPFVAKIEDTCLNIGGIIVPQSFSFITGLPFYVTKKVFYDFPKAVFE